MMAELSLLNTICNNRKGEKNMAKESKWSKKKEQTTEVIREIVEKLGALSERDAKGWQMECNVVSWNDGIPKVDIRAWNEDYSRCGKGIRLTDDEAQKLGEILVKAFE